MLQLRTPWKRDIRPGNRGRPLILKEKASRLPSVQVMLSRSLPARVAVTAHPTQCRRAERAAGFRHPHDTLSDPAFFQGVGQPQFAMIGDFFSNLNHHISLEVSIFINDKSCWYPFGYAFVASGSKVCTMVPSYATSDVQFSTVSTDKVQTFSLFPSPMKMSIFHPSLVPWRPSVEVLGIEVAL
jgi:hypothetical protein